MSDRRVLIARNPKCGHIDLVVADDPEVLLQQADELKDFLDDGYKLQWVDSEDFKAGKSGEFLCNCKGSTPASRPPTVDPPAPLPPRPAADGCHCPTCGRRRRIEELRRVISSSHNREDLKQAGESLLEIVLDQHYRLKDLEEAHA